jgi:hypothetical protein
MGNQPMQPIYLDDKGTARFKENAIVRYILDNGGIDLNQLAFIDFSVEDREQFAQLIGYSVSGFGELGYVTDATYNKADTELNDLVATNPDAKTLLLESAQSSPHKDDSKLDEPVEGELDLGEPNPYSPLYYEIEAILRSNTAHKATQKLEALIAKAVQESRLDELKLLQWSDDIPDDVKDVIFYPYVKNRMAALQANKDDI